MVMAATQEAPKPRPFLKWAGGKRQLLEQFQPLFPNSYTRYIEPMVGGGAVFFCLAPRSSILMDLNADLIEVYSVVRDSVEALIASLADHRNEEQYFYQVRALDPSQLTPVERAARFIFLNKTCYNGLYRVNKRNQFNVPYGKYKNPRIVSDDELRRASAALQNTELKIGDFERVLDFAEKGDFVYIDPPYQPLSSTASFTGYTPDSFRIDEQKRLATVFTKLDQTGCRVMLSNSDTSLIRELYGKYHLVTVSAKRAINSKGDKRGPISEVVVLNY